MNLLIVLLILFASLFLVVTLLDGKSKPLDSEQESKLSKWLMVAVAVLLFIALLKNL